MSLTDLLTLVRREARRQDDRLALPQIVDFAWESARCGCDLGVKAAVDDLVRIGPGAVQTLLNRCADDADPRGLSTHPADVWFAAYADARGKADYAQCRQLARGAGDQLGAWTRHVLVGVAQARVGVAR